MRLATLELSGFLCLFVVASIVLGAANALALPEALGSSTYTFTSKEGEFTTGSGLAIKCKADKGSGETVSTTELTASVDLEKCTIGGLAAQSLSDKGGVILFAKLSGHLCYINKSTSATGVLFKMPAGGVHVEVPSLGALLLITGGVVGSISPVNSKSKTFTISFASSGTGCEGGGDDFLSVESEHGGTTEPMCEVGTESVTMASEVEVMA